MNYTQLYTLYNLSSDVILLLFVLLKHRRSDDLFGHCFQRLYCCYFVVNRSFINILPSLVRNGSARLL